MRGFFDKYTLAEHWARFITAPRGAATSVRFHDRDWMIDSWSRVTRFGQSLPQCVLHGDVHLGNLYIDTDGAPGFFDPLASRGPGMLEVSYHVSASIDLADRARWEGDLVHHYLDELRANGADAPPFDVAMDQYTIFLLYGLFIWMTTESHYQAEVVNTANAARVSAAMVDLDSIALIAALEP
jgi:aminoglycoside phosphotransferase (APT) family kinase protein